MNDDIKECIQRIREAERESDDDGMYDPGQVLGDALELADEVARLDAERDRLAGLLRDSVPMLTAYKASLDSKGEAYEDKASRVGYQLMHTKAALAELEKNK